jgi:putative flavoprotein involved in K+ transport
MTSVAGRHHTPGAVRVGLRWLHSEPSSVLAGVGADAAHIVEHITRQRGR